MKLPNVRKPCRDCPFRKDCLKGWLGASRMHQILSEPSFVCHKNTALQCAGHMLMKGIENAFVKLAGQLQLKTGLRGKHLVFENESDCVDHHRNGRDNYLEKSNG